MPLPPRPNVTQAIEVLKVHQLRRENKVIFDEIKTLRQEVADHAHGLEDVKNNASPWKDQIREIQKSVDNLLARFSVLEAGLNDNSEFNKGLTARLEQYQTVWSEDKLRLLAHVAECSRQYEASRDNIIGTIEQTNSRLSHVEEILHVLQSERGVEADAGKIADLEQRIEHVLAAVSTRVEYCRQYHNSVVPETPNAASSEIDRGESFTIWSAPADLSEIATDTLMMRY